MRKIIFAAAATLYALAAPGQSPRLEKDLTYDRHTLPDSVFQHDKIRTRLARLDSIQSDPKAVWAIVRNRRNEHGTAPLAKGWRNDEYNSPVDRYGVMRNQSVPLYTAEDTQTPERYGRDGSLVKILGMNADSTHYLIEAYNAGGVWHVPTKYVKMLDHGVEFTKAVMVDRARQNISTVEKVDGRWLVRSQNPCTTGLHHPPYAHPTPLGMYVIQEKLSKMMYTHDGSSAIAGYAPWASRFTNGAYLHGVPVNSPNGAIVEFSSTLGTTPRSHECVRNASSHARHIYDWGTEGETIVFVFD